MVDLVGRAEVETKLVCVLLGPDVDVADRSDCATAGKGGLEDHVVAVVVLDLATRLGRLPMSAVPVLWALATVHAECAGTCHHHHHHRTRVWSDTTVGITGFYLSSNEHHVSNVTTPPLMRRWISTLYTSPAPSREGKGEMVGVGPPSSPL
jgi:hypothetical protein